MKKDLLDEVLKPYGKNSIMLKELLENGLDRSELLKTLFDQSEMTRVKAEAYEQHYRPYRKELVKQIGFLSTVIEHPVPDWVVTAYKANYFQVRKEYLKMHDGLSPKKLIPKGLTWKAMINKKIVCLFDSIKPAADLVNKKAGQKRYKKTDIYKLIACLWNYTYGVFEGSLTHEQIKKRYENNFKKYLK